MKRFMRISMSVLALIVLSVMAAQADRFRGGVWIGPGWYGPPPYVYPYYYPPPVIVQQPAPAPEVYVQQPEQDFWYYCAEAKAYYPYVKQCPGGWLKVVPFEPAQQPQSPQQPQETR